MANLENLESQKCVETDVLLKTTNVGAPKRRLALKALVALSATALVAAVAVPRSNRSVKVTALGGEEDAMKLAVETAKFSVEYINGITDDVIKQAEEARNSIDTLQTSMEYLGAKDLKEYTIKVATGATKLKRIATEALQIKKNMLKLTSAQVKLLDKGNFEETAPKARKIMARMLAVIIPEVKKLKKETMDVELLFSEAQATAQYMATMTKRPPSKRACGTPCPPPNSTLTRRHLPWAPAV